MTTVNPLFVKLCIPNGLEEVLEGLAREVLRRQPSNIHRFAAVYFQKLLGIRKDAEDSGAELNLKALIARGKFIDINDDDLRLEDAKGLFVDYLDASSPCRKEKVTIEIDPNESITDFSSQISNEMQIGEAVSDDRILTNVETELTPKLPADVVLQEPVGIILQDTQTSINQIDVNSKLFDTEGQQEREKLNSEDLQTFPYRDENLVKFSSSSMQDELTAENDLKDAESDISEAQSISIQSDGTVIDNLILNNNQDNSDFELSNVANDKRSTEMTLLDPQESEFNDDEAKEFNMFSSSIPNKEITIENELKSHAPSLSSSEITAVENNDTEQFDSLQKTDAIVIKADTSTEAIIKEPVEITLIHTERPGIDDQDPDNVSSLSFIAIEDHAIKNDLQNAEHNLNTSESIAPQQEGVELDVLTFDSDHTEVNTEIRSSEGGNHQEEIRLVHTQESALNDKDPEDMSSSSLIQEAVINENELNHKAHSLNALDNNEQKISDFECIEQMQTTGQNEMNSAVSAAVVHKELSEIILTDTSDFTDGGENPNKFSTTTTQGNLSTEVKEQDTKNNLYEQENIIITNELNSESNEMNSGMHTAAIYKESSEVVLDHIKGSACSDTDPVTFSLSIVEEEPTIQNELKVTTKNLEEKALDNDPIINKVQNEMNSEIPVTTNHQELVNKLDLTLTDEDPVKLSSSVSQEELNHEIKFSSTVNDIDGEENSAKESNGIEYIAPEINDYMNDKSLEIPATAVYISPTENELQLQNDILESDDSLLNNGQSETVSEISSVIVQNEPQEIALESVQETIYSDEEPNKPSKFLTHNEMADETDLKEPINGLYNSKENLNQNDEFLLDDTAMKNEGNEVNIEVSAAVKHEESADNPPSDVTNADTVKLTTLMQEEQIITNTGFINEDVGHDEELNKAEKETNYKIPVIVTHGQQNGENIFIQESTSNGVNTIYATEINESEVIDKAIDKQCATSEPEEIMLEHSDKQSEQHKESEFSQAYYNNETDENSNTNAQTSHIQNFDSQNEYILKDNEKTEFNESDKGVVLNDSVSGPNNDIQNLDIVSNVNPLSTPNSDEDKTTNELELQLHNVHEEETIMNEFPPSATLSDVIEISEKIPEIVNPSNSIVTVSEEVAGSIKESENGLGYSYDERATETFQEDLTDPSTKGLHKEENNMEFSENSEIVLTNEISSELSEYLEKGTGSYNEHKMEDAICQTELQPFLQFHQVINEPVQYNGVHIKDDNRVISTDETENQSIEENRSNDFSETYINAESNEIIDIVALNSSEPLKKFNLVDTESANELKEECSELLKNEVIQDLQVTDSNETENKIVGEEKIVEGSIVNDEPQLQTINYMDNSIIEAAVSEEINNTQNLTVEGKIKQSNDLITANEASISDNQIEQIYQAEEQMENEGFGSLQNSEKKLFEENAGSLKHDDQNIEMSLAFQEHLDKIEMLKNKNYIQPTDNEADQIAEATIENPNKEQVIAAEVEDSAEDTADINQNLLMNEVQNLTLGETDGMNSNVETATREFTENRDALLPEDRIKHSDIEMPDITSTELADDFIHNQPVNMLIMVDEAKNYEQDGINAQIGEMPAETQNVQTDFEDNVKHENQSNNDSIFNESQNVDSSLSSEKMEESVIPMNISDQVNNGTINESLNETLTVPEIDHLEEADEILSESNEIDKAPLRDVIHKTLEQNENTSNIKTIESDRVNNITESQSMNEIPFIERQEIKLTSEMDNSEKLSNVNSFDVQIDNLPEKVEIVVENEQMVDERPSAEDDENEIIGETSTDQSEDNLVKSSTEDDKEFIEQETIINSQRNGSSMLRDPVSLHSTVIEMDINGEEQSNLGNGSTTVEAQLENVYSTEKVIESPTKTISNIKNDLNNINEEVKNDINVESNMPEPSINSTNVENIENNKSHVEDFLDSLEEFKNNGDMSESQICEDLVLNADLISVNQGELFNMPEKSQRGTELNLENDVTKDMDHTPRSLETQETLALSEMNDITEPEITVSVNDLAIEKKSSSDIRNSSEEEQFMSAENQNGILDIEKLSLAFANNDTDMESEDNSIKQMKNNNIENNVELFQNGIHPVSKDVMISQISEMLNEPTEPLVDINDSDVIVDEKILVNNQNQITLDDEKSLNLEQEEQLREKLRHDKLKTSMESFEEFHPTTANYETKHNEDRIEESQDDFFSSENKLIDGTQKEGKADIFFNEDLVTLDEDTHNKTLKIPLPDQKNDEGIQKYSFQSLNDSIIIQKSDKINDNVEITSNEECNLPSDIRNINVEPNNDESMEVLSETDIDKREIEIHSVNNYEGHTEMSSSLQHIFTGTDSNNTDLERDLNDRNMPDNKNVQLNISENELNMGFAKSMETNNSEGIIQSDKEIVRNNSELNNADNLINTVKIKEEDYFTDLENGSELKENFRDEDDADNVDAQNSDNVNNVKSPTDNLTNINDLNVFQEVHQDVNDTTDRPNHILEETTHETYVDRKINQNNVDDVDKTSVTETLELPENDTLKTNENDSPNELKVNETSKFNVNNTLNEPDMNETITSTNVNEKILREGANKETDPIDVAKQDLNDNAGRNESTIHKESTSETHMDEHLVPDVSAHTFFANSNTTEEQNDGRKLPILAENDKHALSHNQVYDIWQSDPQDDDVSVTEVEHNTPHEPEAMILSNDEKSYQKIMSRNDNTTIPSNNNDTETSKLKDNFDDVVELPFKSTVETSELTEGKVPPIHEDAAAITEEINVNEGLLAIIKSDNKNSDSLEQAETETDLAKDS